MRSKTPRNSIGGENPMASTIDKELDKLWRRRHEMSDEAWLENAPVLLGIAVGQMVQLREVREVLQSGGRVEDIVVKIDQILNGGEADGNDT
jgi:hypothetical protein